MLSTMSENGDRDPVKDFLTTGRSGRRNALPNILSEHALTTTADLPDNFKGLSTDDGDEEKAAGMSTDGPKDESGHEAAGPSS